MAITYVTNYQATPVGLQTSCTVPFTGAQTAGDLLAVVIGWSDATAALAATGPVTDTVGNFYQQVVPLLQAQGVSQTVWYALNIDGAPANANTLTVAFAGSGANYPDVRVLEFSGAATAGASDATTANSLNSSSGSPTVTTATATFSASEVIVAGGTTSGGFGAGLGTGWTDFETPNQDVFGYNIVSSTGSYTATGNTASPCVMQIIAFSATSLTGGNTATLPWTLPVAAGSAAAVIPAPTNINRAPMIRASVY